MADNDSDSGLGAILVILLIVAAAIAVILIFVPIGVVFGSGVSIANYYKSFTENVSVEKPSI